jgi:hypothetical protein
LAVNLKKMKNFGGKLQKTEKFWWENLKLRILAGNLKNGEILAGNFKNDLFWREKV